MTFRYVPFEWNWNSGVLKYAAVSSLVALAAVCASGCGGGGLYGHARTYQYLETEADAHAREVTPTYEEVRRARPNAYAGQLIGWFGIVRRVEWTRQGAVLTLQQRPHEERHLCQNESEDSCRVTVGARDVGGFVARVSRVHPRDVQNSGTPLHEGSLVKIYGVFSGEMTEALEPIFDVDVYRHWPAFTYVDTRANAYMRR